MKTTVLVIAGIIAGASVIFSVVLGWQNRADSDKISKPIVAFTIGALATALSFVFTAKRDYRKEEITTFYLYEGKGYSPLNWQGNPELRPFIEHGLFSNAKTNIEEFIRRNPDLKNSPHDLYRTLLIEQIFDLLHEMFMTSWDIKRRVRTLPNVTVSSVGPEEIRPSTLITRSQLIELFPSKLLSKGESPLHGPIHLPPGSELQVIPPTRSSDEWIIKNRFVTVTFRTEFIGQFAGTGNIREIIGWDKEKDKELGVIGYLLVVQAEFDPLKSGHPEMKLYKSWVENIVSMLKDHFDSQAALKEFLRPRRAPIQQQ